MANSKIQAQLELLTKMERACLSAIYWLLRYEHKITGTGIGYLCQLMPSEEVYPKFSKGDVFTSAEVRKTLEELQGRGIIQGCTFGGQAYYGNCKLKLPLTEQEALPLVKTPAEGLSSVKDKQRAVQIFKNLKQLGVTAEAFVGVETPSLVQNMDGGPHPTYMACLHAFFKVAGVYEIRGESPHRYRFLADIDSLETTELEDLEVASPPLTEKDYQDKYAFATTELSLSDISKPLDSIQVLLAEVTPQIRPNLEKFLTTLGSALPQLLEETALDKISSQEVQDLRDQLADVIQERDAALVRSEKLQKQIEGYKLILQNGDTTARLP